MSTDIKVSYTATLLDKKSIAPDVLQLRFEKPNNFVFESGCFVQFQILHENKIVLRSYSISSTPDNPYLEFCIKLLPNGIGSLFVKHIQLGNKLSFIGPYGHFVKETKPQPSFFVATGVGLAPIISILTSHVPTDTSGKEYILLLGMRFEDDLFWIDRLDALTKFSPFFSYYVTLSRPNINKWKGLRGHVTEHVMHYFVNHTVYICGNPKMITDVRLILIKNGLDPKRIHFEIL